MVGATRAFALQPAKSIPASRSSPSRTARRSGLARAIGFARIRAGGRAQPPRLRPYGQLRAKPKGAHTSLAGTKGVRFAIAGKFMGSVRFIRILLLGALLAMTPAANV